MPITINGTGSISGLSAGGLPDASVTLAELESGVQSGVCKAWVNFNGTGTVAIRADYNITSITDNGVGDYTLSFTNAFSDTNYAFVSASRISASTAALTANSICHPVTYSTGSVRVHTGRTSANTCDDHEFANFAIFR